MKKKSPKAYIFAGANASGKSTFIAFLLENNLIDGIYINADLILKKELNLEETKENYLKAFRIQSQKIKKCVKNKNDIILEIVVSKNVIDKLKKAGYYITYIFIGTETPKINALYLVQRVSEGGHDVLMRDLIRRWHLSLKNLKTIKDIVDCLILIDNSNITKPPTLLLSYFHNELCYINNDIDLSKIRWIDILNFKEKIADTTLSKSEEYQFCQSIRRKLHRYTRTLERSYQEKNKLLFANSKSKARHKQYNISFKPKP